MLQWFQVFNLYAYVFCRSSPTANSAAYTYLRQLPEITGERTSPVKAAYTRSPAFSRYCVTAAAPENSNNMSEIKTKATKSNISRDIWFSGKSNLTGANGGPSYYICEHIDNMHYFEDTKTFGPFCKFHKKPMAEVECGLDCPEFGYCASCGGFSAVRCQECDIIR